MKISTTSLFIGPGVALANNPSWEPDEGGRYPPCPGEETASINASCTTQPRRIIQSGVQTHLYRTSILRRDMPQFHSGWEGDRGDIGATLYIARVPLKGYFHHRDHTLTQAMGSCLSPLKHPNGGLGASNGRGGRPFRPPQPLSQCALSRL